MPSLASRDSLPEALCRIYSAIYRSNPGFVTGFLTLSLTPTMAKPTNKLQGNQESVHDRESRGTVARSADDARGLKKGSPKGLGSQKSRGDISEMLVANPGKSSSLAMADQEPLLAEETLTSEAHRADHARAAKNGAKQGLASPELCCNKIANDVPTNKKMEDRVEKWEQSNAEGRGAALVRVELKRASGQPLPKRGAVTKAIVVDMKEGVKAGVKKLTDTGRAFCCAPGPFDVDAFVRDLPSPTRSEPTATLWAKV